MIDSQNQPVASSEDHTLSKSLKYLSYLSILGVIFGAFVRLIQYVNNRSLWEDEVNLVLNIVNRSYGELLQPLDYNQAAPPGFLWIEKTAVQIFGNNEYALRLFPFIAGLIALVGFYKLATRYASPVAAPIAIALFACLKHTLYYASEVKQYSSDVMVAVVLSLLLIPLRHQHLNTKQLVILGLLGSVFIWISHPTVFVLAGLELAFFLVASNKQRWMILTNRLPMYFTWLLSFAGLYFLTIRGTLNNETLTSSWDERYPNSLFDVLWLFDAFGRFFYNPLGFLGITDGIAIFAFIIGCIALYRRNRITLLTIAAPILVTIAAAYLEQYPFRERLVLFLTPFAILIIAEGIAFLLNRPRQRFKPVLILGIFIFSALVAVPVLRAAQLVVQPTQVEEIRPVLAYVQTHQAPEDEIYVYAAGQNQFEYYAPKFGYSPDDYIMGKHSMAEGGRRNRELSEKRIKQFRRELRTLRGEGRVWFVFCNALEEEERTFLANIKPIGQQLDRFRQPGAFVYLYDLKPE